MKELWWILGQQWEVVLKLVKHSSGVGIGGVLEPLQATPVIIEDGALVPLYRS
jgi:tetrahydrodipicolinate N-succinyltransferase